jgi:hypothetical protein
LAAVTSDTAAEAGVQRVEQLLSAPGSGPNGAMR